MIATRTANRKKLILSKLPNEAQTAQATRKTLGLIMAAAVRATDDEATDDTAEVTVDSSRAAPQPAMSGCCRARQTPTRTDGALHPFPWAADLCVP
jgi:hypothetical protein